MYMLKKEIEWKKELQNRALFVFETERERERMTNCINVCV